MITVDNRVGSKELLPYFPPGEAVLGRLEYADFAFEGNGPGDIPWRIGIERKTIRDLITCMQSGRFSGHQLKGLINGYNEVYLVVEGLFKANGKDGLLMTYEGGEWRALGLGDNCYMMRDIWLFLNTITVKSNIRWMTTTNPRDTARFVSTLHRWWTWKEYEEHRAHLRPDTGKIASFGKDSFERRVAYQLEGVGWGGGQSIGKSQLIEAEFDSVEEMCLADENRWMQIEGIGKKLSKSIVAELKGESD